MDYPLLASINRVDIFASDIAEAYLNDSTIKKIYHRASDEWGSEIKGTVLVIFRALYGLKTSANFGRNHCCHTLQQMDFKCSLVDNDFYMKEDLKTNDNLYY